MFFSICSVNKSCRDITLNEIKGGGMLIYHLFSRFPFGYSLNPVNFVQPDMKNAGVRKMEIRLKLQFFICKY